MQYRSFPKLPDVRISILGFGCMRLPTLDGDYDWEFCQIQYNLRTRSTRPDPRGCGMPRPAGSA